MGILYGNRGDLEQAAISYREALNRNPDYFNSRSRLGRLLTRLDQEEETFQEIRAAIRTYSRNPSPYLYLAQLLESLG
jgi:tetratricopeptide (TPR) repeat protein